MDRIQSFGESKATEAASPTVHPQKEITEYDLGRASHLHTPVKVFRVMRLCEKFTKKRLVFSTVARERIRVCFRAPILRVDFFKPLLKSVGVESNESGTRYSMLINNENRQCWQVFGKAVTLNWPKYETDGTVMHA